MGTNLDMRWTAMRAAVESRIEQAEASRREQEARQALPLGASIASNILRSILSMMDEIEEAPECKFCCEPVTDGSVVEYDFAPSEPAHEACVERAMEAQVSA